MGTKYHVASSHRVGNELNRRLIKIIIERKEKINWYAFINSAYGYSKAIKWIIDHNHFVILGYDEDNVGFELFYRNTINGQSFDKSLCRANTSKENALDSDYLELNNDIKEILISFIDAKIKSKKEHDVKNAEEALEKYVDFLNHDNQ